MTQNRLKAPIDIQKHPSTFTSEFAEPRQGGPHIGIDLAPDSHTSERIDILSMQEGKVVKIGSQLNEKGRGYGNFVVVENPDGTGYFYAHLESTTVESGDSINAGDTIGNMGDTGSPKDRHLHIEKLTPEAIREIKKDPSPKSVGIAGKSAGLKYRIDITEDLLTAFANLADDYARELGKKFEQPLNMKAHTVKQTRAH